VGGGHGPIPATVREQGRDGDLGRVAAPRADASKIVFDEPFHAAGIRDPTAHVLELVDAIHRALDRYDPAAPRLQHGDGRVAWVLLRDAIRRGLDTRIGLEDTLVGPDGEWAAANEALVRAARELGAGGPNRGSGRTR